MADVSVIASATDLPVSADLENGFGDSPEVVAETIRLAAAAGAVGGSIEDSTRQPGQPIYEHEHAVERIRAAAAAARAHPFEFTLTARAENYLVGRPDVGDTIRRLQAYQMADPVLTPGLTSQEDIAEVVRSGIVGQRGNGLQGSIEPRRTFGDGSQAGQRRQRSRGLGRFFAARDERTRHLYLRQRGRELSRD